MEIGISGITQGIAAIDGIEIPIGGGKLLGKEFCFFFIGRTYSIIGNQGCRIGKVLADAFAQGPEKFATIGAGSLALMRFLKVFSDKGRYGDNCFLLQLIGDDFLGMGWPEISGGLRFEVFWIEGFPLFNGMRDIGLDALRDNFCNFNRNVRKIGGGEAYRFPWIGRGAVIQAIPVGGVLIPEGAELWNFNIFQLSWICIQISAINQGAEQN